MKRLMVCMFLMGSIGGIAGNIGEAHNSYLDCFEASLPDGKASLLDLLDTLVQNCHFIPNEYDYAEFITNYSLLGESTIANFEEGGLDAVIAPYRRRLGPNHLEYLFILEDILVESISFQEAFDRLSSLYDDAVSKLCGRSNADIAVLAAIDIAASSSLYWGPREDGASQRTLKAKWWQVVLADVAGGVVGGLFGGGAGAVGLGSACSGFVARLD